MTSKYSTCHWCHVMNRESFSDKDVAEVLNNSFIPIKVDREERPDIDKVYMSFSEAMTGQGGWPLNIIATPEGHPFYIGTYFPKNTSNRMVGIIEMLNQINGLWINDNEKMIEESNYIVDQVKKINSDFQAGDIGFNTFATAKDSLIKIYDKENGGFGTRPKFPMPQYLLYLLNYYELNSDHEVLKMVEQTLENMYKGGIYDHIGYGFYRYSVDEKWLVPHFEKMLYDNALLSLVYTKAFEIIDNDLYKNVAEKIYEFVIRDMLSENGGFYSALDADSEGVEGKYYLFDYDEPINLLGEEWGELYNKHYNITKEGNFEGSNIPNLLGIILDDINSRDIASLDSITQMLFTYRDRRVAPHRDEKILTSWNGLMIGSLAIAGTTFKTEFYIKRAKDAADFIIKKSIDKDGNLLSTHIGGESYNNAYLEDYSFFIFGLLELYKANNDENYLNLAKRLTDNMLDLFGDKDGGSLYFYSYKSEELVLRPKEIYDGAIPSGNAFALIDLTALFTLTGDEKYANYGKNIIHSYGGSINTNPLAHLYSIIGIKNSI